MRHKAVFLVTAVALLLPAAAEAQEPCAPPEVRGFFAPRESIRSGDPVSLAIAGEGIASVVVTRGPLHVRRLSDGFALRGTFKRIGRQTIAIDAVSACGARKPAALRLTVRRRCSTARDRFVAEVQCDRERGSVRVLASGLGTTATWLDAPCNDTGKPPPELVPVARAASCVASPEPYPVTQRLPITAGRRVTVTLGMPARRVSLRLGDRRRGPLVKLARGRRLDADGKRWRVTLPRTISPAYDRLFVDARRAAGTDSYTVGISVRRAAS